MGGERLILPRSVVGELRAHARAEVPNEACGLLAGDRGTGRVTSFHPARNEHRSPLRFSVHPEDLVRLMLGIEAAGDELVAIFHSHVASSAVPSPADVRGAEAYSGVLHVIATLAEPEPADLRAWRIEDGRADEVPLIIG